MHANPARTVENLRQKLSQLSTGCERLMTGKLEMMKHAVANSTARLDVLSPLQTLARGYAIATGDRGTVITDSGQLASGDRVRLYLHRGRALCRVEELEKP